MAYPVKNFPLFRCKLEIYLTFLLFILSSSIALLKDATYIISFSFAS